MNISGNLVFIPISYRGTRGFADFKLHLEDLDIEKTGTGYYPIHYFIIFLGDRPDGPV